MSGVTFDPARKLPLYFRVARDGSKTINFTDTNGGNFDISGYTFAINIYDQSGGNLVLSLTESSALTKPTNYQLTITVTDTVSNIRPAQYYYVMNRTDGSSLVKTWTNGPCYFHEGEFDGLTNTTSVVTIDESGTGVTLTISDTASPTSASQAEVNAGTATGVYVEPEKLANRDVDVVALVDGATIALTGEKHTLATSRSAITFTNSFTGDGIFLEIVMSATSSTLTFPSGYLCQVGGTASGDNTAALSGTSGDKYVVSIIKVGSQYYVGVMNMKQ